MRQSSILGPPSAKRQGSFAMTLRFQNQLVSQIDCGIHRIHTPQNVRRAGILVPPSAQKRNFSDPPGISISGHLHTCTPAHLPRKARAERVDVCLRVNLSVSGLGSRDLTQTRRVGGRISMRVQFESKRWQSAPVDLTLASACPAHSDFEVSRWCF